MGLFITLVTALVVAAIIFGVTVLVSGSDPALVPAEPDGRAVPLPGSRPLLEADIADVRFDTALRGYRMAQVDQALRRAAYDIGYKEELIGVLEAEVTALRDGRLEDADALRRAREEALVPAAPGNSAPTTENNDISGGTAESSEVAVKSDEAAAPDSTVKA
ncbi:DivIVA domain-containing protein [Catenuloplanes nepalensis]|uniref:DivIVA domain-containing protein n=1 Tax=Catenuloplanes nepalensis TaxID=587533 RepID=A0ABT9N2Q5_9ACTN|nr:DivIVA domain-containing protein [Catenuloplanes nepalensis]MDP9797968.1 DivIVA domain-containing protein [Catenuloplanes nepalensis]